MLLSIHRRASSSLLLTRDTGADLGSHDVLPEHFALQILELVPQGVTVGGSDLLNSLIDLQPRVTVPLVLSILRRPIPLLQNHQPFNHPLLQVAHRHQETEMGQEGSEGPEDPADLGPADDYEGTRTKATTIEPAIWLMREKGQIMRMVRRGRASTSTTTSSRESGG